jgi:hypothetical protein
VRSSFQAVPYRKSGAQEGSGRPISILIESCFNLLVESRISLVRHLHDRSGKAPKRTWLGVFGRRSHFCGGCGMEIRGPLKTKFL